jgi:hypothetical protein
MPRNFAASFNIPKYSVSGALTGKLLRAFKFDEFRLIHITFKMFMICQNCKAEVDDDLIFCTNCGERLFESPADTPTVLMTEPIYKPPGDGKPPKSSSPLKWVALIIALIAIPASIFGVFLLLKSQGSSTVSQNTTKTKTPTATPTRKANINQNANQNASNSNAGNMNAAKPAKKTEIFNDRVEIEPQSHYAVPFEVETETAKMTGEVTILEGEKLDGFVYLKKTFDENFPDENFKMFGFGTSRTTDVRQTLVKEDYVLVFVNKSDKPLIIQGHFSLE